MRCSCGWADPDVHEPYEQAVHVDLSPDDARAALEDPTALLATIRDQIARPRVSLRDGEPVAYSEPYVMRPGDFT